jgi:non-canonical (house-cleaning) NTP pyrophosphatase
MVNAPKKFNDKVKNWERALDEDYKKIKKIKNVKGIVGLLTERIMEDPLKAQSI